MLEYRYDFLVCVPFADPATESINRIADSWGSVVTRPQNGDPLETAAHGLEVWTGDTGPSDRPFLLGLFGLEVNVVVAIDGVNRESKYSELHSITEQMKLVLLFAAVRGSHGILIADYTQDAIVLRMENGHLILNQDWPGWKRWPEILDVIPRPHRMRKLFGPS